MKTETLEEPSTAPSPKLWAAALIFDSIFVMIFGGAVASTIYQHWKAPKPRIVATKPAKKIETPAPVEAPAPVPEAAEPAKVLPTLPVAKVSAPPAAPAEPGKAIPVEFQFKDPTAKTVELGGAFIVRNNGRKTMVRHGNGLWTLTLYLTPNTYRYFFLVNGKKILDPANSKSDRGASVRVVN